MAHDNFNVNLEKKRKKEEMLLRVNNDIKIWRKKDKIGIKINIERKVQ